MAATVGFDELIYGLVVTTAKGAKQLPALYKDGKPELSQGFLGTPFESSEFDAPEDEPEARRPILRFERTQEVCELVSALGEWLIATLTEKSINLLGVQLTFERWNVCTISTMRARMKRPPFKDSAASVSPSQSVSVRER